MSQPFLTVSAAGLKAAGVGLTAAEAVACVVLAGDALDWSSDAPDPSHLLLRSDGRIDVTPGAHRPPRVEAYARLEAEGVIRAQRGSGFYVAGSNLPPMALAEMGPPRERAIDPFWVSRESLDADPAA